MRPGQRVRLVPSPFSEIYPSESLPGPLAPDHDTAARLSFVSHLSRSASDALDGTDAERG